MSLQPQSGSEPAARIRVDHTGVAADRPEVGPVAEGVIFSTGHVAVVMGDDVKTPLGATGVLSWPSIEHLEHEIEDWPYDLSVHGEPFEE